MQKLDVFIPLFAHVFPSVALLCAHVWRFDSVPELQFSKFAFCLGEENPLQSFLRRLRKVVATVFKKFLVVYGGLSGHILHENHREICYLQGKVYVAARSIQRVKGGTKSLP